MIDYDKLRQAHSLCDKLDFDSWTLDHSYGKRISYLHLSFEDKDGLVCENEYDCFDDLLSMLKELTTTKPKYVAGDIVWSLWQEEIHSFIAEQCVKDSDGYFLYTDSTLPKDTMWVESQVSSKH